VSAPGLQRRRIGRTGPRSRRKKKRPLAEEEGFLAVEKEGDANCSVGFK
jgi:hypothetical protein